MEHNSLRNALRNKIFQEQVPVKVSICTITYNHCNYIRECIEGFLEQETDFRVEIIIHDDASNDGTTKIINEYASRYPSIIRIITQSENQYSRGVNPYYAFVFPVAQGDYIAICDGDDYWNDPNKLTTQVTLLENEKDTSIVYGPVKAIDANGNEVAHSGGARWDLSPNELKSAPAINTLTVCFRNIFKNTPPPIFLRNSPIGDLTVWCLLGYHGRGRYLADLPPATYRVHNGGILSLVDPNKQKLMSAIAYLNIAAYNSDRKDITASVNALKKAINLINRTGIAHYFDADTNVFKQMINLCKTKLKRWGAKPH